MANAAGWTGEAGDAAKARDQYAELVPVMEQVMGRDHPKVRIARSKLAGLTGETGDAAGARDQYATLVRDFERLLGPRHPETLEDRGRCLRHAASLSSCVSAGRRADACSFSWLPR
jgi:hypothetical protein